MDTRICLLLLVCIAYAAARSVNQCPCPRIMRPVCGLDGQTYNNPCLARCVGMKEFRFGACPRQPTRPRPQPCICQMNYDPVCGEDGTTYGNQCGADCVGVQVVSNGECRDKRDVDDELEFDARSVGGRGSQCPCPRIMRPVCGLNGQTYNNPCLARCAGMREFRYGACPRQPTRPRPQPCICPMNYDPVCGEDGTTYGNQCGADCVGVQVSFTGECKDKRAVPAQLPAGVPVQLPARPACICHFDYRPVCGENGRVYGNACAAGCDNVAVAYEGPCIMHT